MISTPRANTVEICEVQCFIEVTCESKNFVLTEGGDHVCELNDSDGVRDPDDLVARRDFFHRAIEVSSLLASRLQCTANIVVYSVGIVPGK